MSPNEVSPLRFALIGNLDGWKDKELRLKVINYAALAERMVARLQQEFFQTRIHISLYVLRKVR